MPKRQLNLRGDFGKSLVSSERPALWKTFLKVMPHTKFLAAGSFVITTAAVTFIIHGKKKI